jgi:DNA-binding IclR family transcriptional regulator
MSNKRDKANYLIQSVCHALDVLEELAKAGGEVGVTQLSRALKLHKNNVFRILATLELRGFARQNSDTEDYALGPKVLQLGQAYATQSRLVARATPILKHLCEQTGETASLAVLQNGEVQFPLSLESKRAVRAAARIATAVPAKQCAVGKLLLAQLQESLLAEMIAGGTPADQTLKAQANDLRTSGLIIEKGSAESELITIAKVVRGLNNNVVAAIELLVPQYRSKIESLMPAFDGAVQALSTSLGAATLGISTTIEREISSPSEARAK